MKSVQLCHASDPQPVFTIDSLFDHQLIEPTFLRVVFDEDKSFSIEQIQSAEFLPMDQFPIPNQRKSGSIYWTKLILENQLDIKREFWLTVQADYSYSYLVRASGEIENSQTGIMMPYKDKTIQSQKRRFANYIPIAINSKETVTLFIKNLYPGGFPPISEIQFIETPGNAVLQNLKVERNENFGNGFFHALLLILIIYCIFYSIFAKEQFGYILALYCIFYSIYFLNADFYLYKLDFISNSPIRFNLIGLNAVNFGILFEVIFVQKYLSLKSRFPIWNRIFIGMIYLAVLTIIATTAFYLSSKDFASSVHLISLFQSIFLVFKLLAIVKAWQIKDFRIRIFTFAWTISLLFAMAAWIAYYVFPAINGLMILKLAISSFVSIMVISLSYYAAKSRTDKLTLEKESIQQQLITERQRNLNLEIEKENRLLEIQTKNLQKLDQLKTRFFANVSHELRTPLTLILGPIKDSLKRNKLTKQDFTNLTMVLRSGKRLQKLVNEILDLNKLESGKLELQPGKVLWYPFLRNIVANFESLANFKNINYNFAYEGNEKLRVELDEKKMETVLINLLSNAFKFTPQNGTINVRVKNNGSYLKVSVTDSGRGISVEDLPHIFNRFYQAKNQNGLEEGGTGIGLALSKELIQLMGGTIVAESEISKGSKFIVKVPRVEIFGQMTDKEALTIKSLETEPQENSNKHLEEETKPAVSDNIKPGILLVEDNLDLQIFIKSLLEPKYEVILAENGKVALDLLSVDGRRSTVDGEDSKNRLPSTVYRLPDLIISDIMMPFMDGYQLLKALKAHEAYSRIPMIMLTARAEKDDRLKALRIGVDDYMTKPFEDEELLARVDNLLRNNAQRKAFYLEMAKESSTTTLHSAQPVEENLNAELIESSNNEQMEWLMELEQTVQTHISSFNYTVEELARQMAMSKRSLELKTKSLTGLTPRKYIQEIRLTQALDLLENKKVNSVKAMVYEIGGKDVSYFSKLFKKRFGRFPSDYLN